jgi:glycosyltransferase involved in cell wall biosynthesis
MITKKKKGIKKLAIYALHPIIYQTQIFSNLQKVVGKKKLNLEIKVFFDSDLSLKQSFFHEINTSFKPDTPNLLIGYKYDFLFKYKVFNNYIYEKIYFLSRYIHAIRKINLFKPDAILIHGYQTLTSWIIFLYAKFYGIKIIWRGEVVGRISEGLIRRQLKKILLFFYFRCCDAFLFSCSKNLNYLLDYGIPRDKLFFGPSAVNNSFFQNEYAKKKGKKIFYRSLHHINQSDYVVLFCSRFTLRKCPFDLIKAVSELKSRKNILLLFVGDGPERSKMENLCELLKVRSLFVGFKNQSEISIFYTISDVLAITSIYDPSPKVINEAMNFSLPIIASSEIGTVPDLVIHNKNGYVYDARDVTQLKKFIEKLSTNIKLRNNFGLHSKLIVSKWSHIRNARAIIEALFFLRILNTN